MWVTQSLDQNMDQRLEYPFPFLLFSVCMCNYLLANSVLYDCSSIELEEAFFSEGASQPQDAFLTHFSVHTVLLFFIHQLLL